MKSVIVYRDGEIKMRIPAELRNGFLRTGTGNILINNDLISGSGMSRDQVVAGLKSGKITPAIERLGMHIGDNGNGLVCRWAEDVEAERRAQAQAEYDALPADVRAGREERAEIDRLFHLANQALYHDTDDDNVMRGNQLRVTARRRLAEWRENYPDQANQERRQELLAQAEEQDRLATGAHYYDADGWLDADARQVRADEFAGQAAKLRDQANI